ncbi:MAG: hypothetical protein KBS79_02855 [Lachnospiraceae bacterium]|nr:hypothetical protein [Candidatus Minthocola equi]
MDEFKKAYDNFLPGEHEKDIVLSNILDESDSSSSGKEEQMKKKWKSVMVSVASAAAAFAFGCAAYANGWFGLGDFLGEKDVEIVPRYQDVEETEAGSTSPTIQVGEDKILYQFLYTCGPLGSPEANAFKEWDDYRREYAWNHSSALDEDVDLNNYKDLVYSAYNNEMQKKLDEIVSKYNLKLITGEVDSESEEDFFKRLGKKKFYGPLKVAEGTNWYGYIMSNGSFHAENMYDTKDGVLFMTMGYQTSGYLPKSGRINIGDIDNYEQWQFDTEDGYPVFVLDNNSETPKNKIFIQLDNGFLYMSVDLTYMPDRTVTYKEVTAKIPDADLEENLGIRKLTRDEVKRLIANMDLAALGAPSRNSDFKLMFE